MTILWIVNYVFPDVADQLGIQQNTSGGWLLDLSRQIAEMPETNLCIVSMYQGKVLKEYDINHIRYFCIPGGGKKAIMYSKSIARYWKVIDQRVNPDVVHLHGTEFTHGEVYIDNFPNRRYLLTVQGILGSISREATACIPLHVQLFCHTFKELVRFNGMRQVKWLFKKNAKHEQQIIKKVEYITGRTFWDEQLVHRINPRAKYYRCFFNLREEFYKAAKWNIKTIDRKTIYAGTSAQLSYKGGHIIIQAFNEVLKQLPDAKLILLLNTDSSGEPIAKNGFQKYILELIDRLGIKNSIIFLPAQKAAGVIRIMQKSNCMVVGSAMENASSTLREGMHIGLPCIASFRGGMTYLIDDGEDGFYYDYPEYEYLAGRICQILTNDELAISFSQKAIIKAEGWHNREKNRNDYLDIYMDICQKGLL